MPEQMVIAGAGLVWDSKQTFLSWNVQPYLEELQNTPDGRVRLPL